VKRWVAALGLLSLVGATALPVSAAGGKGEVAAEPPRARINADRDGNRLFDNLESLLQGRPPTDEIAVIVQVNQAADDAMLAAAVRKAESLQVKARWDQAIHGFSATVQAGQVRAEYGVDGDRDGNAGTYTAEDVPTGVPNPTS
jgi:hypothetical protein